MRSLQLGVHLFTSMHNYYNHLSVSDVIHSTDELLGIVLACLSSQHYQSQITLYDG